MRLEPCLAAAGDLFLGAACHGCGAPWWGVCPACRGRLRACRPYLTRPDPCPDAFPPTVTCSPYDDLLRGLITAHKDHAALALSRVLADRLSQSVHALLHHLGSSGPVLVVPVPSAAAAVRRRGYDATWTLTRLAVRQLRSQHPVRAGRMLSQRGGLADQAGLGAAARRANLAGGLQLRRGTDLRSVRGCAGVLLVDDLVTTGASLAEAARVLRGAAVPVLGAATVAATVRRRPRTA